MQIGQILVEQRWVSPEALARALADQPRHGQRICSLLIARGQLDPDNAARALANQHAVPGVLQRHLEGRDPALAALLPAALAHAHLALPIGRTRHGELIVCVRDPRPGLAEILTAVVGPVVIAVAPAHQLEQLIAEAYDGAGDPSFEVDLTSRPIAVITEPTATGLEPPPPALGGLGGGLGELTLVGLDDARVARDPSQSGQLAAAWPRAATGSYPPLAPATLPPPRALTRPPAPGAAPPTLGDSVLAIERAASLDDALAAALRFLAGRFRHAVLFTISEGAALGDRGHPLAAEVIQAITVPLSAPSIVQAAHDLRRLATAAPAGAGVIQDRLARALGHPRPIAAAPVLAGDDVVQVIAAGDPIGDPDGAAEDLQRLARALGDAHRRAG